MSGSARWSAISEHQNPTLNFWPRSHGRRWQRGKGGSLVMASVKNFASNWIMSFAWHGPHRPTWENIYIYIFGMVVCMWLR